MDDKITLESYTDEAAKNPAYAAFRDRVKVRVHDDWDWGFTSGSNPVTVLLKDGTTVATECVTAAGWPPDLLPWKEVQEKFRRCAEPVLGKAKVEESLALAQELEKLDEINSLATAVLGVV
jgi:2-methylcitrate dehydratase PrpD